MDEYYEAIRRLPPTLLRQLAQLPQQQAAAVHEIRLRSGRPVLLATAEGPVTLAKALSSAQPLPPLSHQQLQECFYALCEHSVHSYEQQLSQGFFTLPGGHRVGLAGVLHLENGVFKGFQTVTSLNLRIARTILPELPATLREHLSAPFRGLMLIGEPGSGKTTLLRSVSALLSTLGKKVTVVDERMELWPCGASGFAGPVPLHCDVLTGFQKQQGILMALRCLGPQVILCDELGDETDFDAVQKGAQGGVSFVCTLHGQTAEAPLQRFGCERRQLAACFSCIAVLQGPGKPGQIKEVSWL